MARKSKSNSADIDWYLISIDRLKQIGLVVLILLVGFVGWWFWNNQKESPRQAAESAIAEARQALNSLAAAPEFNSHRNEFNRAQQKLDEANAHLASSRFREAQDSAVESNTISRSALSGGTAADNDARFLTVEGDVKFQKAASNDWKDAEARVPLFNGDWVKTGEKASAELIFSNGSLYTIGPNALLEIFSTVNPTTSQKTNAVQMRVGSVEVATSNDASAVRTPGTQIIIESESTTHVGVDQGQATQVMATRGASSVAPEKGGAPVRVATGEKVSANPQGVISPVKKLSPAPALLSPADGQVFQLLPNLTVDFLWGEQAGGGTGYVLQVSRSRLFATQEINSRRTNVSASAKVTSEGAFYWRVASIGPDGDIGPFSTFRRFRVSGGGKSSADRTAPVLRMKVPFHVGGQFYTFAGTTEPGATVFINDEEVDVESAGAFQKLVGFDKVGRNTVVIKAIDPAGNQTVQSQTVMVEE
ncbi:MAG TPA: FecR domain-containing protein [Thermoanaerobaculia bacterium]|jgi:hypothetical protein